MIYLILLLGFILRLININQSLWLDEAINVLAAKDLGFWHFVTGYPIGDFHPPGYFVILWIFSHLFGFSEIIVRFPSILFGIFTIFLTYFLGKKLFNRNLGLLAALLLAINPLHIYYSQEARMYAFSAFAVTFSFYSLLNLLSSSKKNILIYAFSVFLVLYSDYVAYFAIIPQIIFVLFFFKNKLKKFLLSLGLGILTFIPWGIIFVNQLISGLETSKNVPGWAKVVGGASVKNLALVFVKSVVGRITFFEKNIYYPVLTLIGIVYTFIFYISIRKFKNEIMLLYLWIFIPTLLAYLVSFYIPVLSYFRMIYILPAIVLVVAYGFSQLKGFVKNFLLVIIFLISTVSTFLYYTNPNFQREDWKGLNQFLKTTENHTILFEDGNTPKPLEYYSGKNENFIGAIKNFPATNEIDLINIEERVSSKKRIYLVDYLVEISDPGRLVDKKLTGLGFKVVRVHNFSGVGLVYEYSR